jgi:uncharacterized cupin superfamily protein
LEKIAAVLGVTLTGLFGPQEADAGSIVRSSSRGRILSSWSQAEIEILTPANGTSPLDAVMITMAAGGQSGRSPASHSGNEFALVFDGEVVLTLNDEVHYLQRGDTATFSSRTPHLWENRGSSSTQIVIVSSHFTH